MRIRAGAICGDPCIRRPPAQRLPHPTPLLPQGERGTAARRPHDPCPRPLRPRVAHRAADRRRRLGWRGILPDPGRDHAVRARARPQSACAARSGDPVGRRTARDPARARPAVPGRPRGRLARYSRHRIAAARTRGAHQMRRPLDRERAAAHRRQPPVRADAGDDAAAADAGRGHAARRDAGADHDRSDRRRAHRVAEARRPSDGGPGAAADDSRADLRRRGGVGRKRRRGAVP